MAVKGAIGVAGICVIVFAVFQYDFIKYSFSKYFMEVESKPSYSADVSNEIENTSTTLKVTGVHSAATLSSECKTWNDDFEHFIQTSFQMLNSEADTYDDFVDTFTKRLPSRTLEILESVLKNDAELDDFDCHWSVNTRHFFTILSDIEKGEITSFSFSLKSLTSDPATLITFLGLFIDNKDYIDIQITDIASSINSAKWSLLLFLLEQNTYREDRVYGYSTILDELTEVLVKSPGSCPRDGLKTLISIWVSIDENIALKRFEALSPIADNKVLFDMLSKFKYTEEAVQANAAAIFSDTFFEKNDNFEAQALVTFFNDNSLYDMSFILLHYVFESIRISEAEGLVSIARHIIEESYEIDITKHWLSVLLDANPTSIWALNKRLETEDNCCNREWAERLRLAIESSDESEKYQEEYLNAIFTIETDNSENATPYESLQLIQEARQYIDDPRLEGHLASLYLDIGDGHNAIEILQSLMDEGIDIPQIHNDYSLALFDIGQAGEAISFARKALELTPYNYDLRNNLGTFYQATGEYDAALEIYDNIIDELGSDNVDAYYAIKNKVLLLVEKGDFEFAKSALKDIPTHQVSHINEVSTLLNIMLLSNNNNMKEQISQYKATYNASHRRLSGKYNEKVLTRILPSLPVEYQAVINELYLSNVRK